MVSVAAAICALIGGIGSLAAQVVVTPDPPPLVLCSRWGESNCQARNAVRDVTGVVASGVTPPVERSGATRAKKFFRGVAKGVFFVPRLAVSAALIPIRGTVAFVSHYDLVERTIDLLYNDARTAAILPIAGYQSGFGIHGGVTAFHHNLFGHQERMSGTAKFGGRHIQSYQVRFGADRLLATPVWVDLLGRYESNPRLLFAGFGAPMSGGVFGIDREASYYRQDRALGVAAGGVTFGDHALFQPGVRGIVNARSFADPPARVRVTPVSDVYDTNDLVGFAGGTTTAEFQVIASFDGRVHRGLWRKGLFTEAFVGRVFTDDAYAHVGAEVSLDVPIWRNTRVLSFRSALEGVTGSIEEIPFSELPRLGGPDRLRGYPQDAFRDSIAVLGSVEYSYPIHKNVSGNLFADFGRVAGELDELTTLRGWRLGLGGGLLIGSEDDIALRLSVAGGENLQFYLGTDFARAFGRRSRQL